MDDTIGFFDPEAARGFARARKAWIDGERAMLAQQRGVAATAEVSQSSLAASEPIQHQAGLPKFHGYLVEIPAGWRALRPVFYPIPDVPDEPVLPNMPAALLKGWRRFQVGVLLCRLGTDDQEAAQEFADGVLLEAAFLGQDGQYLQAAPVRPAYGVLPLAAANSNRSNRFAGGVCLVLLPLIDPSPSPKRAIPPTIMMVDGVCVYIGFDEGAA